MNLKNLADTLRPKSLVLCFLLMAALAVAMVVYALPTRSQVRLDAHNSITTLPFLPDMKTTNLPGAKQYIYSFSVYYTDTRLEQTAYSITPGNCLQVIRVNHENVPFNKLDICNRQPGTYWLYEPPVTIDLAAYIHNGRNLIEVKTYRPEFDMGPVVLFGNTLSKWLGLAMITTACAMLVIVMERLTGEKVSGGILTCGFLVYMHRMSHMGVGLYAMDLPGHIDYIAYVAQHWSLPNPYWGWSYYHPPLYYTIGAIIVSMVDTLRSFDAFAFLQLFSVGCFMAFLCFSALILRQFITLQTAYYSALVLLVFYPGGILCSSRVDSNLLFYAFYSGCLYCMLRWLKSGNDKKGARNFGVILILVGLSIATRGNTLILLPLLLLAMLHRKITFGWPTHLMRNPWVRTGLVIVGMGVIASFGRTEYYRLTDVNHRPFLIGNIGMISRRLILPEASFSKLLVPNIPLYFERPFWSVWEDANGRQYFWNSMLKSSLFGEFFWAEHRSAAYVLDFLLLVIIVYTLDGAIMHRRFLRSRSEWWLCLISLAIPIIALMENRVLYAYASSEDFRYIYPALASFCGLFGLVLERHIQEWRPFRKALGIVLCVAFAVCSVWFYTT